MGRIHVSLLHTSAATYLRMAIQFISVVIVSRLLEPAEIGLFSVTMALVAIGQLLRDFGVGQYLVQEKELDESKIRSAFGIAFVMSAGVAVILWIAAAPLAAFYDQEGVREVMHVLVLNFLILPIGAPSLALLRRRFHFGKVAIVELASTVAQVAMTVLLALNGFSYMSMAWSSVFATVVLILMLVVVRAPHVFILPGFAHWRSITAFGGFACGSNMVQHFSMMAPDVAMGKLLSFEAVAFFSRAQGLGRIFNDGILGAASKVAQPSFAEYNRSDRPLKLEYLRSVTLMTALAWPFYGTLALFADPVILFLFGENWKASVLLLQIFCLRYAVFAYFSLSDSLFWGVGAAKTMLRKNTIVSVVRIVLTVAAAFHSLEAVVWAQVVITTFNFAVTQRYLGRLIDVSLLEVLRAGRLSFAAAAAGLAPSVLGVAIIETPGIVGALILGSCGVAAWLAVLALVRHPLMRELSIVFQIVLRLVMRRGPSVT
ncbi:lipopolysaccharide biosynthesis protein [Caenispirillum salinarum]|nr:lipopolysaccharide biosynthesis protein [Caenispirillum salinarum]